MNNIYTYNNIVTHSAYLQHVYSSIVYRVCVYAIYISSVCIYVYSKIGNAIKGKMYIEGGEKRPNISLFAHLKGLRQFKHMSTAHERTHRITLLLYCQIIHIMLNAIWDGLYITECLCKLKNRIVATRDKGKSNTIDLDSYIVTHTTAHAHTLASEFPSTDLETKKTANGHLPTSKFFPPKTFFRDTITSLPIYIYTRIKNLYTYTYTHILYNLNRGIDYIVCLLSIPKFLEIFLSKNLFQKQPIFINRPSVYLKGVLKSKQLF